MQIRLSTLALRSRGDITRKSPKTGVSVASQKGLMSGKKMFKKVTPLLNPKGLEIPPNSGPRFSDETWEQMSFSLDGPPHHMCSLRPSTLNHWLGQGNVMFLHLSVCPQGDMMSPPVWLSGPMFLQGRVCLYEGGLPPVGRSALEGEVSACWRQYLQNQKSGRYAFYWNVFLLKLLECIPLFAD